MFWYVMGSGEVFQRSNATQMNTHYTYLLVNFFCLVVPFIFSFHPKIGFYKKFPAFFLSNLITLVLFVTWDSLFTKHGVWRFNPDYVSGIYFFDLPVEEILFFFCIPFACLFTYHCIANVFSVKEKFMVARIIALFLIIFLAAVGAVYSGRLYTSVTFFLLAILLVYLLYKRVDFLYRFFVMYTLILIPFFLSNGLLTGMFTDEPVVLYNNEENLGIRMITIPFEDLFYGMFLLLLNVSIFEFFEQSNHKILRTTS